MMNAAAILWLLCFNVKGFETVISYLYLRFMLGLNYFMNIYVLHNMCCPPLTLLRLKAVGIKNTQKIDY